MPVRAKISTLNSLESFVAPGYPAAVGLRSPAAGATDAIVFPATLSTTNHYYDGTYLEVTAGAGAGGVTQVLVYDGATQTATVHPPFAAAPDSTTVFTIFGVSGVAQAATADTLTLSAAEATTDNIYAGVHIRVETGAGAGQHRRIFSYNGATKVALVDEPWEKPPAAGDAYIIYGEAGLLDSSTSADVTLPTTARGSAQANFYAGLAIEITSAGNAGAIGQFSNISGYDETTRVAALTKPWAVPPTGAVTYRIFGGWGGEYEEAYDYSMVNLHIASKATEYGVHEITTSQTKNGFSSVGDVVSSTHTTYWGQFIRGPKVGDRESSRNVGGRYVRIVVFVFSHAANGGIQVRYSADQNSHTTHATDDYLGQGAHCELTRAVIAARIDRSDVYQNLHANNRGELAVDLPRSSFDDLRTAELTPQIQMNFVAECGPQELVFSKAGSQSTVRHEVSQYYLRLGDSPITPAVASGDHAVMRTKRIGRYRAGLGTVVRLTAIFDPPDKEILQTVGLAATGVALEFGYSVDHATQGGARFGINRATGGQLEIRTLDVSAASKKGKIVLTLPNFPAGPARGATGGPGGSQRFSVDVAAKDPATEVARKIAASADPAWGDHGWDTQNIGSRVVFRGVGVGARDTAAYAFDGGSTGVVANSIQQVHAGIADELPETRELNVRDVARAAGNISISLDGVAANAVAVVPGTHDTAEKVAWAIANSASVPWLSYGAGWRAEIIGAAGTVIRFTGLTTGARSGACTFTDTDGTGVAIDTYAQRRAGAPRADHWVWQEDWNQDRCDGTGLSRFVLNPRLGNVYSFSFQYLGFGGITYMIENPKTTRFIPVHTVEYAGTSTQTHLTNPHMSLQAAIRSTGAAEQRKHSLSLASWAYFTEGPVGHIAPRFTAVSKNLSMATGSEQAVLLLKHPEIFNTGPSQVGIFVRDIIYGLEATASTISTVFVRVNAVLSGGFPAWRAVSYPHTPMLVATELTDGSDMDTMLVAGGSLISASGSAGDVSNGQLLNNEFELDRGDVLVVSVLPTGGKPNIRVSANWVEDH